MRTSSHDSALRSLHAQRSTATSHVERDRFSRLFSWVYPTLWTLPPIAQATPQGHTPRWVWWSIIFLSALGLVVLGAIAWYLLRHAPRPAPRSQQPPPPQPNTQTPSAKLAYLPETRAAIGYEQDVLDTALVTMACTFCGLHYELSAHFCARDGAPLERVEGDSALLSMCEHETRCPTCDTVYEAGSVFCPEDHTRLILEDTDPPIDAPTNVLICPACRSEHPPNLKICPHDLTPLLPITGRFTTGVSSHNSKDGELRVCPHCAKTAHAPSKYCTLDGTELVKLN